MAADAAARAARERLAAAVRRLVDATVSTGVDDPARLDRLSADVDALAAELAAVRHPGPYSGLLGRPDPATGWRDPHDFLPLTPMAGRFNPIAPPLRIVAVDGAAEGTVALGRQHTGPPGIVHGGSLASLCDQMVAAAAWVAGFEGVTRALHVRLRRPVPVGAELHLRATAERVDERRATARCEIRRAPATAAATPDPRPQVDGERAPADGVAGELCVEAEAELVLAGAVTGPRRPSG